MNAHKISEYIENLPLKKTFCNGYKTDDVYDVICNICSMYNQLLSESYAENDDLKRELEYMEMGRCLREEYKASMTPEVKWEPKPEPKPEIKVEPEEKPEPKIEPELKPEMKTFCEDNENQEERSDNTMTDKELQKLKRGEVLEVLLEQSKSMDVLKMQLQEKDAIIDSLNKKLAERKIDIQEAGTIAEASFKLNGVFEAAEKAAQQYLENLKELHDRERRIVSAKEEEVENRCAAMLKATQERCDFMKENTIRECEEMEASVKTRCKALEDAVESKCRKREEEAENNCAYLDAKAKEAVDKRWGELSERLEEFYKAHQGIRELLAMTNKG